MRGSTGGWAWMPTRRSRRARCIGACSAAEHDSQLIPPSQPGFRALIFACQHACLVIQKAPCLAPMLRIGALRGCGRKRTAGNSPRCARLRHPSVFFSFGLHCSALRPRGPNTNEDRLANASPRSRSDLWSDNAEGESDRNAAKLLNSYSIVVATPLASLAAPVLGPRVARREAQGRRVSGALRRCGQLFEDRQSDPSSGRIPSDRASQ